MDWLVPMYLLRVRREKKMMVEQFGDALLVTRLVALKQVNIDAVSYETIRQVLKKTNSNWLWAFDFGKQRAE